MMEKSLETNLKHYRLSHHEYERMKTLLGREPKPIEWPLFSALWSEHCSYKSSKIHLKKFSATLNQSVLNAEGENAGVVDLGFDERIVFKMESHNHPSFIEPYQGAATGVGGILRDIFTMGAMPIALGDYLCFGVPGAERMGALVDGVVRGIGGYGNSVGVPTVTGQTEFELEYNKNVLVNAMALGLLRPGEKVALSAAQGVGNFVVYVGAKTGRDGVHGAAMASQAFDADSEAKKPNVQIGDPYFEKLLIESCLEVLQKNLVVSIQDMGAAGLTSSSFEMAAKGGLGMRLRLDTIPVRDSSIQPEEILLSESQERMLLVCKPEKFLELQARFASWGLDAAHVGDLTSERRIELYWKNEMLTAIDPQMLVDQAPVYERPYHPYRAKHKLLSQSEFAQVVPLSESIFSSAQFTSRKNIYRQYDQRVGLKTKTGAESDVAILQLPDSKRWLAMAVGCRPYLMRMDAQIGSLDAVFYPCLQMAAKAFNPVAITDCLNFGNPEKPEIMSEFVTAVESITQASLALKAPVISGNVSFYNETLGENIISTPAIGVVGINVKEINTPKDHFQSVGNLVYVFSCAMLEIGTATDESLKLKTSYLGQFDLEKATVFLQNIIQLVASVRIESTQVSSRGGLGLSLCKMALSGLGYTASIKLNANDLWRDKLYELIVEVTPENSQALENQGTKLGLSFRKIGSVAKNQLKLNDGTHLDLGLCIKNYEKGLRGLFENLA